MHQVHIGWGRYLFNPVSVIFMSGFRKPDNVHQWFKVYKNG